MSKLFENYARWDIEIISGNGTKVYDSEEKEYLDFTSGIGVCNVGHCNPSVVAATETQLKQLWHTSNLFTHSLQEKVAEKLVQSSMGAAVFFCNSGAEANEAAIKLARKYTGKSKIITFNKSFHGRTFGTMAATGQDKIKAGFGPMLESFIHLPFNDLQALEKELDHETAAVMLEVIQGEGGVNPANEDFLQGIEKLCKEKGALLIIDEVQTGIGRTGKAFGYQHYNISPDIITSAKGLGNGFPTAAMIGTEKVKSAFNPGSHGSTFGGNPLAMSAANATLDIIMNADFLAEVEEKGNYLSEKLDDMFAKVPEFKGTRHKGLMIGCEFSKEVSDIVTQLRQNGLLVITAGPNVIRLLPPLTVTYEEINEALEILANTLIEQKQLV
ncbi:acetylornithine transaminase [Lederbergia lenta]|uniref:Acetylornithine aminotransferase n=1 Tax=Lederbergia lenta TaxID=1467 RepID=A0A2X4W5J5_LEDLE|nr:acetylornithine transaminase [Lederbergia lenta]MCM3109691.1 acetylornithine transaminase [Lederbergia lenta]MEC2324558.1 acetylornithine transaminase [Lederbergia lenta]SQI59476.1 acetylornithine aminotransferase [Lederbergia lenta]